jgi:hypothetical protein
MSPFIFNYYKAPPKSIGAAWLRSDAGKVFKPIVSGPAKAASDPLDTQQAFTAIGEAVPIVFCRFRNSKGGILISPGATEARYEADDFNNVTVSYHYVLSEGQVDSVQVRDVRQSSCRVGTHTQTYNRRAGTWTPGNFIEDRTLFQFTFDGTTWYNGTLDGYTWRWIYNGQEYSCCGTGPSQVLYLRNNNDYVKPDAPVNCGSVGSYPNMSTLSFTNTIPDGFDQWNRQVHIFMRGGMYVTRLYDSVFGPSDNFADLVKWLFENTARVPATMIDTAGLTAAATFLEYNDLTCNCNLTSKINLPQMLATWAPYFLLGESSDAGKKGLRPLLPTLANGAINTGVIVDEYTFTENVIILDTFEVDYVSLAERQPFVVQVIWRQQLEGDIGIIRTYERRFTGTAEAGPYESHDLSEFCTSEDHAAKVGAYILGKRVYPTHSIRFSARPQAHNAILAAGSIIRVRLEREATNFVASVHDYLYQVVNITETLTGDVSYEAVHFPVDSQGRSLIALDVAAAVGSGTLLTNNRTAPSCDKNSPTNTTVPPEEYSYPDEDVDPIDSSIPSGDPGTGGFGDSPPTLPLTVIEDAYDNQQASIQLGPTGGVYGDAVALRGGGGSSGSIEWLSNGAFSGYGRTYFPQPQDIGNEITARITRPDGTIITTEPVPIYGINPLFAKDGGISATVTYTTFGSFVFTNCANPADSTTTDGPNYVFTVNYTNVKSLRTYTEDVDQPGTQELAAVLQYSIGCNNGGARIFRNGVRAWEYADGSTGSASIWGGNITALNAYSYSSFHGSVITSIVLTAANPSYGNIGDEVLSLGLLEAIAAGASYWTKGVVQIV